MKRRNALILLAGGIAGAGVAAGGVRTFRLHRQPRTDPLLTDAHLESLAASPNNGPRVLFIGNSMVLRHDVPHLVVQEAARDGMALDAATAAARGARLVETMRLPALDPLLRPGMWDAIVLQDYTSMPLSAFDRWGSAQAIGRIAARTTPTPLVLFPPWPAAEGNRVYTDAGLFATEPDGPDDYADRTMDFYGGIASHHGACLAPVPETWREAVQAGQDLYAPDGHHANPAGATLAARIVWECLQEVVTPTDS